MKRSEIFFSALLIPIDYLALLAGFVIAYTLRNGVLLVSPSTINAITPKVEVLYAPGGAILPLATYLHYIWYIIPAMLVIFALTGLYRMRSSTPWSQRFFHILIGVSVGEFFILLLFLLKGDFFLPRSTVVYSWILATLLVFLGRIGVRLIQKLLYRFNIGMVRVYIVGTAEVTDAIMQSLHLQPYSTYKLVKRTDQLSLQELKREIDRKLIDEVIVVNEAYDKHELAAIRNQCLEQRVAFSFVPSLFSVLHSSYSIRDEGGLPIIEVRPTPLDGWGRVVKRLFDIFGSIIFIILLSPILLLVAIIMKIVSPGPLIYTQPRIGKDGKDVLIFKFRSMKQEYCTGPGYDGDVFFQELLEKNLNLKKEWTEKGKLTNDPRVTAFGDFIRKTSLDELPQLFNVLRGSMSLVGPRPIIREQLEDYGETGRILFTVRPGITGPWQVAGRSDLSMAARAALNAEYIEHWNIGRDILILLQTIPVLLRRTEGA